MCILFMCDIIRSQIQTWLIKSMDFDLQTWMFLNVLSSMYLTYIL